ncbi:hypothetical protein M378DRAFT_172965 [Amanita muscaria Koide BX008]|uniref:Uncharacterized protein n=1 Tax=Amanita muscaria (strain Koide BX008) TaxID=946122 RepID=A0A0C2S0D0_AMAMK|nr:hypothetical protein M378DRAFT_172965 [Amanita muscaria Koide BX008]
MSDNGYKSFSRLPGCCNASYPTSYDFDLCTKHLQVDSMINEWKHFLLLEAEMITDCAV